jgi:outer membrane receptor for ferrienterochelin and colicin
MMKRRLLVVAALAFARVNAQENPPVVQIKASADTLRRNETASRITINRAEILEHGDTSVLDVLKRLPGVIVTDGAPRMRGMGGAYTQVLLNGERPPAGFSLEQLAPEMIEKIEVLRAATAEYSTQAIAGTINIVLRKSAPRPSREVAAAINGGRSAFGARIAPSMSGKDYTLGGQLNLSDVRRPEYSGEAHNAADGTPRSLRTTGGGVRDYFRSAGMNSRVNWTLAPGSTVSWQTFAQALVFTADRALETAVPFGPPYPYSHFGFRRWERFATLRNDATWSLRTETGARFDTTLGTDIGDTLSKRWSRSTDINTLPTLQRLYLNSPATQRISWTGKYAWPVAGGHSVTAGWDFAFNSLQNHELQEEESFPGVTPSSFDRNLHARVTRLAFYAQDEYEFSPQFSLYAGLRHEAGRTRTSGSDFETKSSHADVTSPLMQGLYKLPNKQQLRAALTRTFRAPTTDQLTPRSFRSEENTAVSSDRGGNPGLRPEIARGLDLAYEQYGENGALLSLTAGVRRIQDVIRSSTVFEGERWVSAPRNLGDARTRSLELEVKVPKDSLKFSFSVGRHWSEVLDVPGPGNRLGRQAPWTGNASIDYRQGAWSAGASASLTTAGWSRVSAEQSDYDSVQRKLEAYLAWRNEARSQWRLTALNLQRPDVLNGSRYTDATGISESWSRTPSRVSVRLAYEGQY